MESAHDAIVAFLPPGQIFLFNRQAQRIFGYSEPELLGEQLDGLFVAERDNYAAGLTAYLATANQQWFKEARLLMGIRRDQAQIRLEIAITIVDTGDRPFYMATLRERDSSPG